MHVARCTSHANASCMVNCVWDPSFDALTCGPVLIVPRRQKNKQASERSKPEQAAKAPNASYAPCGTLLVTLSLQPTKALENKTGLFSSKK